MSGYASAEVDKPHKTGRMTLLSGKRFTYSAPKRLRNEISLKPWTPVRKKSFIFIGNNWLMIFKTRILFQMWTGWHNNLLHLEPLLRRTSSNGSENRGNKISSDDRRLLCVLLDTLCRHEFVVCGEFEIYRLNIAYILQCAASLYFVKLCYKTYRFYKVTKSCVNCFIIRFLIQVYAWRWERYAPVAMDTRSCVPDRFCQRDRQSTPLRWKCRHGGIAWRNLWFVGDEGYPVKFKTTGKISVCTYANSVSKWENFCISVFTYAP